MIAALLPAVIVTLPGEVAVIESIPYLPLPERLLERMVNALSRPIRYLVGGVFAMPCLYLAAYGSGYIDI
jgi:hypothetical protein